MNERQKILETFVQTVADFRPFADGAMAASALRVLAWRAMQLTLSCKRCINGSCPTCITLKLARETCTCTSWETCELCAAQPPYSDDK